MSSNTARQTLLLSNLPVIFSSHSLFVKEILKAINTTNPYVVQKYALLPSLSLDSNKTPKALLDERFNIVSIFRDGNKRKHCFIGFTEPSSAEQFLSTFKDKLTVRGRKVNIDMAKHDAYWYISKSDANACNQLRKHMIAKRDPHLLASMKTKRSCRRLRSKLRKKGMPEDKIEEIVRRRRLKHLPAIGKKQELSSDSSSTISATPTIEPIPAPLPNRHKVVDVGANPPNKTLLVQGLPKDITEQELAAEFASENLVQIRLVQVRRLAFIEYRDVESATEVKNTLGALHNFKDIPATIGYAK